MSESKALQRDGVVVALLNRRQVLVRMNNRRAFSTDRVFRVFQNYALPNPIGGLTTLDIPKEGELKVSAIQSDDIHAVLSAFDVTTEKTIRKPHGGLAGLFEPLIETVATPGGLSARVASEGSLKIFVNPSVEVGDHVSAL